MITIEKGNKVRFVKNHNLIYGQVVSDIVVFWFAFIRITLSGRINVVAADKLIADKWDTKLHTTFNMKRENLGTVNGDVIASS